MTINGLETVLFLDCDKKFMNHNEIWLWVWYQYLKWTLFLYVICPCIYVMRRPLSHCVSHHHHVLLTRISLTLSHPSLLAGLLCYVWYQCRAVIDRFLAGHPTLVCPCEGVHRSTSIMSLSLLLQQCLTCLVHLIWMVFEMGGWWPYSCCFVGCCFQDLFNYSL